MMRAMSIKGRPVSGYLGGGPVGIQLMRRAEALDVAEPQDDVVQTWSENRLRALRVVTVRDFHARRRCAIIAKAALRRC